MSLYYIIRLFLSGLDSIRYAARHTQKYKVNTRSSIQFLVRRKGIMFICGQGGGSGAGKQKYGKGISIKHNT